LFSKGIRASRLRLAMHLMDFAENYSNSCSIKMKGKIVDVLEKDIN
jgi:hypothetical protein